MPVTTPAGDARRAAILAAALHCFLEHGVAGASIEQVCARSGASVGSVYHHFGGKEGLAGAVFRAALREYQGVFLAALRAHPDGAEGIRAVVRAHLDWCLVRASDRARFLLLHGDAARGAGSPELLAMNREFFGQAMTWLRRHVGALSLDLAYALWLGPAQEYCRLHLAGRTNSDPASAAEVLADGAVRALLATDHEETAWK